MIVGATTSDGATFACKVNGGGPVRVAVSTNASMTSPVFTSSQAVDAQGVAKVAITGLAANTRFWWRVEDNSTIDTSRTGTFLTLPPAGLPASFTVAGASCAGLDPDFPGVAGGEPDPIRVSNHPVYATIREQALANDWPLWFNFGDWGYPDYGDATVDNLANRRAYYDANLAQPNQAALLEDLASDYAWDDHDYLRNNLGGANANAAQVYRERFPHDPLPDPNAIYHDKPVGRVLFVVADVRYYRSPNGDPDGPGKTMLGAAQKAWMADLLVNTDAKLLVWVMPSQWNGTSADSWASFPTEQAEMIAMFESTGFLGRMVIWGGDYHGVALDTGANSPGGIPVLQSASIDATPGSGSGGTYDLGTLDGRNQYGTIGVQDLGTHLTVTLTAWRGLSTVFEYTFSVQGTAPAPAATGALLRTLSGSHRPTFEARVVSTFQTGGDPDGEEILILEGDVTLDGTAEVQRTLEMVTAGINEQTRRSVWPRKATDLLAPYGNEVFIRRGVDVGSEVLWVPLGYFRLDTPEQDVAPYGPIRLSCQDRMSGIVDGRLMAPREFTGVRTVASVFQELVGEIYPNAVILFDDATGSSTLGRPLVAEESRYQVLWDIATSRGKIMYWDGEGILRVQAPPDPAELAWEVNAGTGGAQFRASRSLTREGVYNAVVANGEGGDEANPVRAVAVDANPLSPTFFGGRFGKVPIFYSSPLLTTNVQAATAAANLLRRSIGMPFSVTFESVPNPALRPFDPIRVRYGDGNRELHIVETLTIPLNAEAPMTGTTREQTLVVVDV